MTILSINLFPNEGTSTITLPDGSQVQVSPADFLGGWTARKPPFGNNDFKVRETVALQAGVRYEAPAWSNNDLKGKDANGRPVLIERNGKHMPPRAGDLPAEPGPNRMTRYLNVVVDINTYKASGGDLDI